MKCSLYYFILFAAISSHIVGQDKPNINSDYRLRRPNGEPMSTLVNINNISMWAKADGRLGHNPYGAMEGCGIVYPRGTAGVVYAEGILWGGFVNDGHDPALRVGGTKYWTGVKPGCIVSQGIAENSHDADVRIWRIRPDWEAADLSRDASEFFYAPLNHVTQEQITRIREQYEKDWADWPWQKGAPFYDANGNGVMDDGEKPGLAFADQVVWFAANDLDSIRSVNFYPDEKGSPPIGLEMQVTLWTYSSGGSRLNEALKNIIFKRIRLIYKGRDDTPQNAYIDSMFCAQFVDSDVGYSGDDFVGCDTLLQLGYGYNGRMSDRLFSAHHLPPPAIGYVLIQGPMVESSNPSDCAYFGFCTRENFRNLSMTSFWQKAVGTFYTAPNHPKSEYNLMNGYWYHGDNDEMIPFFDSNGNPTKFMLSGDPVKGTGSIDGIDHMHPGSPGERRFQMHSGPFSMALGDTQEVVFAIVGGIGADRLSSITVMKYNAKYALFWAQSVFRNGLKDIPCDSNVQILPNDFVMYPNHPNPFNAETEIRYNLPLPKKVKLTIFSLLGQEIRILADTFQEAGSYTVQWDGRDFLGNAAPSGVYLCRLEAGCWFMTRKMMLVK